MIDPKALRLGNQFREKYSQQIIEVMVISKDMILFSGNFVGFWQAEEIKLSNMVLLQAGFSRKVEMQLPVYQLGDFELYEDEGGMFYCGNEQTDLTIRTFNQLQNLYFSIYNEEVRL